MSASPVRAFAWVYTASHAVVALLLGGLYGGKAAVVAVAAAALMGAAGFRWGLRPRSHPAGEGACGDPPVARPPAEDPPPQPLRETGASSPVLAHEPLAPGEPAPVLAPAAAPGAPAILPADDRLLDERRRGRLVVHARPGQPAWREVESVLDQAARSWKLLAHRDRAGAHVIEYQVRLRKRHGVAELLSALRAGASAHVVSIELKALLLALALGVPGAAAAGPAAETAPAETRTVVPGPQYRAGTLHRWLLGAHHRDLWTAPLEVGVLDLDRFAGGLTLLRRGGRGQTRALRFLGADGHEYTFRSVDKDPQALLSPELQRSFVARLLQDQMSVGHPLGALVVPPILAAADVLHASPVLAVMPDDPRLGDERPEFAGMLGLIEERPTEGEGGEPGFAGAAQVVGSPRLRELLEKDPDDTVDARSYLRARLLDVFVGDWDRHLDQWRWARFGEGKPRVWKAVPRDRDQAFSRVDGLLLWLASFSHPEFVSFKPEYGPPWRATWSGHILDRELLSGLEWPVWEAEARDLQARLTDAVIEEAAHRLPAQPPYDRSAAFLVRAMKARRDRLPAFARGYYEVLASEVDVWATDKREVAEVVFQPDGAVSVDLRGRKEETPRFHRTFLPGETKEVRLFLRGGDDALSVSGADRGRRILVRVVGGGGQDTYASTLTRGGTSVRVYDPRPTHPDPAPGLAFDTHRPTAAPGAARALIGMASTDPPRDWGSRLMPRLLLGYDADLGLVVGGAAALERYGFRQAPYRQRHDLGLAYATVAKGVRAQYLGTFNLQGHRTAFTTTLRASQIDLLHFYGFGNQTPGGDPQEHEVNEDNVRFDLRAVVPLSSSFEVAVGPRLLADHVHTRAGSFVSQVRPYGLGRLDQAGLAAAARWDTRDQPKFASRGVLLAATGSVTPALLDTPRTWGDLAAQAAAHLPLGGPGAVLALRASGRKVFGRAPFTQAAFLGGTDSLRGYPQQRFAGNAAAWGNAELRLRLGRFFLFLPGEGGVFALADAGRVFVDREDSKRWHPAYGGGLWVAFLGRANTVTVGVARGEDDTRAWAGAGFQF